MSLFISDESNRSATVSDVETESTANSSADTKPARKPTWLVPASETTQTWRRSCRRTITLC